MDDEWWVEVTHGPSPDSHIMPEPPESMPMSGYSGFVLRKKEETMPESIKTPLGAEVSVFVTTPDTWLLPAGSVMLQMSIKDVGSYRQAEVVLSDENIDELIKALQEIKRPTETRGERIDRVRKLNEERRRVLSEGVYGGMHTSHEWVTIGPNADELWTACLLCHTRVNDRLASRPCPTKGV